MIARGNRRATIVHDDANYRAYLDRLERYRRRDGVTLHAYVLMTNHVHLLLETCDRPLSRPLPHRCSSARGIDKKRAYSLWRMAFGRNKKEHLIVLTLVLYAISS